jgi:hypothetical protein
LEENKKKTSQFVNDQVRKEKEKEEKIKKLMQTKK